MDNTTMPLVGAMQMIRGGADLAHVRHWQGPYFLVATRYNPSFSEVLKEIPSFQWIADQKAWKIHYLDLPTLEGICFANSYMVKYEAGMAVILLATELIYRGWLVMATSERLGRWSALVAAVPYALAHVGKPVEEVVFSFFAGIAFGLADLEARSIVPSFASHLLGSVLFDALALRG